MGVFFFSSGQCCAACGMSGSQPGIKPEPLAVKAQSPNHSATRELPGWILWSELCSPQNSHVENLTSKMMVRRWNLWEMKQSWGQSPHEWDWCRRFKGELLCSLLTFHVTPTFMRQGFSACSPSFCSVGRNSKEKNSPCSQIPEGHNWCLSCWYNGQEESETWS